MLLNQVAENFSAFGVKNGEQEVASNIPVNPSDY